MKSLFLVTVAVGMGAAMPVWAAAPDPAAAVGPEAQAYGVAQQHLFEAVDKVMAAYRAERQQVDAINNYWKAWCGDRPGCASPAVQ